MGSLYYVDAADWLRAIGLTVVGRVRDGWKTSQAPLERRVRQPHSLGIQWHHTASSDEPGQRHRLADRTRLRRRTRRQHDDHARRLRVDGRRRRSEHRRQRRPAHPVARRRPGRLGELDDLGVRGRQQRRRRALAADPDRRLLRRQQRAQPPLRQPAHRHLLPIALGAGDGWTNRKIDPATAAAVEGPWKPRSTNSSGTWSQDDIRAECARRATTTPEPEPEPTPTPEEDDVIIYLHSYRLHQHLEPAKGSTLTRRRTPRLVASRARSTCSIVQVPRSAHQEPDGHLRADRRRPRSEVSEGSAMVVGRGVGPRPRRLPRRRLGHRADHVRLGPHH